MQIARIARHLFTPAGRVERAFPRATLADVEAAIKASEAGHAGEIVFAVEGALPGPALWRGQSPRERALEAFSQLRVWDTEANNGVLIYVLLADRAVEIVADRGIHARVGEAEWEALCHDMEAAFARTDYRDGAVHGVRRVADHLQRHFPMLPGDRNELPDAPVVL